MNSGEAMDEALTRASEPLPPCGKTGDALTLLLIQGTLAVMRCEDGLRRKQVERAHAQFLALKRTLRELEHGKYDAETSKHVDVLLTHESALGRMLATSMKRAGLRLVDWTVG